MSNSFYEHFENFNLVFGSAKFLHDLEVNYKNMIPQWKRMKSPGNDLIVGLYDFWMKSFRDLVN